MMAQTKLVPLIDQYRDFNVVTIEELLNKDIPPRENILSPWLPSQGLAMVYAPRGVGKTYFALGVAYAVASASNFLGWQATKPRGVLYLDGEMPAIALQERLARLVEGNAIEPQAPIYIINPDFQELGMPDLSQTEHQIALESYIKDVDLIIVDNISTLCRNGRENEAEGWLPIQEWALKQRANGKTILFIHHAGKGGNQRGTSKREDVLDTVISLRHPSDYTPDQGATFEVHFEKSRGFYGPEAEPFEAALTQDESGKQCWVTRSIEDSNYEKVVRLFTDGLNQKDIVIELGISKGQVSKLLKRARAEGRAS